MLNGEKKCYHHQHQDKTRISVFITSFQDCTGSSNQFNRMRIEYETHTDWKAEVKLYYLEIL